MNPKFIWSLLYFDELSIRTACLGSSLTIYFYWLPVMVMARLKLLISTVVGDTVKVILAAVDSPGESLVPVLSNETVIGPSALAGSQFEVVKLRDNDTPIPVFLM